MFVYPLLPANDIGEVTFINAPAAARLVGGFQRSEEGIFAKEPRSDGKAVPNLGTNFSRPLTLRAFVEERMVGGLGGFEGFGYGLAGDDDLVDQVSFELVEDLLPGAVGAVRLARFGLFGDELLVFWRHIRAVE